MPSARKLQNNVRRRRWSWSSIISRDCATWNRQRTGDPGPRLAAARRVQPGRVHRADQPHAVADGRRDSGPSDRCRPGAPGVPVRLGTDLAATDEDEPDDGHTACDTGGKPPDSAPAHDSGEPTGSPANWHGHRHHLRRGAHFDTFGILPTIIVVSALLMAASYKTDRATAQETNKGTAGWSGSASSGG